MDIGSIKEWLGAAALATSIGGVLFAWLTRDASKALKAINDVSKEVGGIDKRVSSIEGELQHAPTKNDIDAINKELAKLATQVAVSNESMVGMRRIIHRVDDWLSKSGAAK